MRHYGPIRTTEVLTSDHEAVIRDAGNYVGRHRQSWLRDLAYKPFPDLSVNGFYFLTGPQ